MDRMPKRVGMGLIAFALIFGVGCKPSETVELAPSSDVPSIPGDSGTGSPPPPPPPPPSPPPPSTPPPGDLTLAAHPRVWMTPERLANAMNHVAANSEQWQAVKRRADAQVARGTAFTADADEWALGDLGMACLVTGDVRYAQRAESLLSQFAVASNDLTRDWGYDYRHLPLTIMAFDWCYSQLSSSVRSQVATWLMDRADWVWPDTNSSRGGAWGVDMPANNYFWGFMMSAAAAIAAHGDDTRTDTSSGPNRPEFHINLARSRWASVVDPFIRGWASGGVFAEGTNYESTRNIALVADAFRTGLGDSTYVSDPFFASLYKWQLHQVAPDGQHYVYLGEQARDSEGSIIYYERTHHLILASFPNVASPPDEAMSYRMVSGWPLNQNSTLGLTAMDMVYWNMAVTPAVDLSSRPNMFVDRNSGIVVFRTSATDLNATLLFFESGPILESHQLFNANGLMVWKRGYWVLGHGQMWDRNYDLGQSSTLYTTGGSQTWQEATGGGGQLLAVDSSDSHLYVAGQASEAYGRANSRPLTDFVRKVVYLTDLDAVVVVDRVGKSSPSASLTWKWWARPVAGAPNASANTFSFSNMDGSATIHGQDLARASLGSVATGSGAYYVQSMSNSGTNTDFSVVAMRIDAAPGARLAETSGRWAITMSNWAISVGKAEATGTSATIDTDASRFLVTDLVADQDYVASDGSGSILFRASPQGVGIFDLAGNGQRQVSVSLQ